jgi:asparagine synthase (glutamine-hydrolysing)
MPNLAGIYTRRPGVVDIEAVLARMARAIDIPAIGYERRMALGSHAGCVNLLRGIATGLSQPVRDATQRTWLMLDGELYNVEELKQHLQRSGVDCDGMDDARVCLALYQLDGESFVQQLNGQFNVVIYCEPDHTLLIANDRYGYRPLFTAETDGRLLFAIEMNAIIVALDRVPQLDGLGLLEILRHGHAFGDRTWLEPIRVLDASTILRASPNGIRRERYFKFRYHDGGATMSSRTYVEGFAVKLRRATQRTMKGPGRVGISLSGGLDSRSVLLSIQPSHFPIPAYTFGYPQSRDVQYARALADLVGAQHRHFAFEPGYLGRVASRVVWRCEGLFPFWSSTSVYFHSEIAAAMDVILTGHCGDMLSGANLRLNMMAAGSRDRLIEILFDWQRRVPETALRRVCHPTFYARYAPQLFDAFRETFAGIESAELPNVTQAFDMEQRQHRNTFHSPSVDRYRFEVRTPFLDNELLDHMLTAPPDWRFAQRAYKKTILHAFPHAAHIPCAATGRRVTPYLAVQQAQARWQDLSNWARRRLPGLNRERPGLGKYFRDVPAEVRADGELRRLILDFADSPSFPEHVFDRAGIRETVQQLDASNENPTHVVAALATFALAFRLFLFTTPTAIPDDIERLLV